MTTARTTVTASPAGQVTHSKRRRFPWFAYACLLPLFVVLGLFAYYPAASGIFHSLYDWRPGFGSPFTGTTNYRTMFGDGVWWQSFENLGWIFLFSVTIGWLLPLLAAELIITLRSERARFVYRTLLIIPMAFPGVVTVLLWGALYDPENGVINRLLRGVGLSTLAHNWLGDPTTALPALLFIGFPFVAGLPFLVFLSTLQKVPPEIFEAADLDGTGRFRRFIAIDLPLMAGQVKLLFFLATISVLQYGFAAYLLTQGGPNNATQVPVLRMLAVAFQGSEWGYAAALSTTLFVIALVLSVVIVVVRRSDDGDVRTL